MYCANCLLSDDFSSTYFIGFLYSYEKKWIFCILFVLNILYFVFVNKWSFCVLLLIWAFGLFVMSGVETEMVSIENPIFVQWTVSHESWLVVTQVHFYCPTLERRCLSSHRINTLSLFLFHVSGQTNFFRYRTLVCPVLFTVRLRLYTSHFISLSVFT
jgi:hypothetical protein